MPLRLIPQIHRATHRIGLHVAALGSPGVTQAEAHVLAHLGETGDATVGDVHRAFGHRRSTLTSVLDRLEARKFIVRTSDERDRRTFVIALTRPGRAAARRVIAHLERFEAAALRGVPAKDLETARRVLGLLAEAGK